MAAGGWRLADMLDAHGGGFGPPLVLAGQTPGSESEHAVTNTDLLRHTLATLAYRAEKALRDPPPGFEAFRPAPQCRPALAIVAHLGDLMEWGERMAHGERRWESFRSPPGMPLSTGSSVPSRRSMPPSPQASGEPLPLEVIFQGPVADALTHVGQLMMMRGMAAAPIRPESYASARIAVGRVGRDQPPERVEFDGDASPQIQSNQP